MEFDEKYTATIMQRVFNSNDEYERIDLVSKSDEQRIPIHRVILMAASKYFAGLLRTNDWNEMPKEFVLDSNGEAIKTFVDYCYTGRIVLTEQNVKECLKIAFDGEIDLLLNKCRDYFSASLSTENVVDVLMTADKYSLSDLQQRASDLLCSHFEQVPATHICKLIIKSELVVNRLLSWFQYDEAGRGEHLTKMLRSIRLEQLSSEFLCKTIEPLFNQFKCVDLLNDEFKRRAMYYTPASRCASAKDGGAVMDDKTAIFCVNRHEFNDDMYGRCNKMIVIVERYDESLNKFAPHLKSPPIDIHDQEPILYENKIFMIGGCPNGVVTDSMTALDMETREMEQLRPMNERRYNPGSIMMGKWIYVFGGFGGSEYLSSCERYNTEKETWQTIKSMKHKRGNASTAIINGLIYVVGGHESACLVESYDPRTDEWTEEMALDKAMWGQPLVSFNGMLYAFLNDREVREFDPVKNVWTEIQTNYRFESVISANGSLFAMTGNGSFGQVTINERKTDFAMNAEVKNPGSLSLHQCRFEE